jgi:hypothetical protein
MKEMVWETVKHPKLGAVIRKTATDVILEKGCVPKDFRCEAIALHEFVRDKIRWTRDVKGHETLIWPVRMLEFKCGDCDDKSMLLASMALSVGFPGVAFKAIAANPSRKDQFSHVFVLLDPFGKGKFVPSDPTVSGVPLGWESPVSFRSMVLKL